LDGFASSSWGGRIAAAISLVDMKLRHCSGRLQKIGSAN
jgi:hypothetical protein